MTFANDHTKLCWEFLLKEKSDASQVLKMEQIGGKLNDLTITIHDIVSPVS